VSSVNLPHGGLKPEAYRAAAQSGCYWARLPSLNSNEMIQNDNADGPVVIDVREATWALEAAYAEIDLGDGLPAAVERLTAATDALRETLTTIEGYRPN
jgi:hypothetical protein